MTDEEIAAHLQEAFNCAADTIKLLKDGTHKLMRLAEIMSDNSSTIEIMLHGGSLWSTCEAMKQMTKVVELTEDTIRCLIRPIDPSYYLLVIYQTKDRSSTLRILYPPGTIDPEDPGNMWSHHVVVWLPPATAQAYANENLEGELPK